MKKSLKRQMIMVFAGLATVILLTLIILNISFLNPYYVMKKQTEFVSLYNSVNSVDDELFTDEETMDWVVRLTEQKNATLLVRSADGLLWFTNVSEYSASILNDQLSGYIMGQTQKTGRTLRTTENYQISRGQDPRNNTEYIEIWGTLDNGATFIIRSPLASIRESAEISNSFLIFVGMGMIVVCSLLVWIIAQKLTNPIRELTIISDRMANLDFDAKYSGHAVNEIGELGANFNRMSDNLQSTISELKKANNELKQDIDRKEKAEEKRTEFIGNISHELKTPLALIQGYAEGLKDGIHSNTKTQEFYCDVIVDEAGKMNGMIKNLLTLNELEFGQDNTVFVRFNITELVANILHSMEILFKQKNVSLNFKYTEDFYVWSDELKTEQVIRNYISNALNHVSNENIIEIKINRSKDKIKISVFNSGTPIPDEDVEHIWEMFYKVDKARTRAYGGNGIGLSIVKAIMDSLHQEYGVKNYDNGVEFWFELDGK
ncbi:MAG: ATP-binding protein [Suipraeoptans sp.]